jgi:hypothetical protein
MIIGDGMCSRKPSASSTDRKEKGCWDRVTDFPYPLCHATQGWTVNRSAALRSGLTSYDQQYRSSWLQPWCHCRKVALHAQVALHCLQWSHSAAAFQGVLALAQPRRQGNLWRAIIRLPFKANATASRSLRDFKHAQ